MNQLNRAMLINVLTSLHAGGENELGVVDQPIQREVHTHFPKIETSSLKGSIRHAFQQERKEDGNDLFGSEEANQASPTTFTDARILFFPMRSANGVFAYVTCPMVWERFCQDMELIGENQFQIWSPKDELAVVSNNSNLVFKHNKKKVMLDEYTLDVCTNSEWDKLLNKIDQVRVRNGFDPVKNNTILVSDDEFSDFVQLSTEVVTRIRIDIETGIVEEGALFTEEYLPPETMMYSLLFVRDGYGQGQERAKDIFEELKSSKLFDLFQIGGNATLGKGFVKCSFIGGDIDE
ncbi:type III-B CRISPR module RAMP protein Cmr4 [Gracilibacillus timonensis]|uniref:type III-B CRISPR module RAMP protein Cmr4 n=1 Tax=Gracilibacillus timonensis TaxID=1816696 RepID=UPI0008245C7A|nr:type III-B CRISPR module RAMP protein Cmr4 [Gracilibacillus timonensis]